MKFGALPPREAEGAIAVHSIRKGGMVLKKGTLIGKAEVAALEAAKVSEIVVARLEPGDVSEETRPPRSRPRSRARACMSTAPSPAAPICSPSRPACWWSTRSAIDALNDVDPAITFATLDAYAPVVAGKMIATVKIIPFAVAGAARDKALAAARGAQPLVRVAPFKVRKVGIISTVLPGLADKVIEKTLKVTEERLAPAGATIVAERRVPHETKALAKALDEVLKAGAEMVVVFGASAIADRRDVIPAAVEAGRRAHRAFRHAGRSRQPDAGRGGERPAGARRAGLRALAEGERLRLGADAAARRPAGQALRHHRPRRRRAADGDRDAAAAARRAGAGDRPHGSPAVVLAAGRSTRMGGPNKLLAEIDGKPLVRIAAEQALASRAQAR